MAGGLERWQGQDATPFGLHKKNLPGLTTKKLNPESQMEG